jgi:hypothetical protein
MGYNADVTVSFFRSTGTGITVRWTWNMNPPEPVVSADGLSQKQDDA